MSLSTLAAASAHAAAARKGFERPAAPTTGPAPFLTEATAWDFAKYAAMQRQLLYPTKAKTEAPFYDVPFAVNVPFEVPFDGGAVRVFFDVNIVWDAPEQAAQVKSPSYPARPLFPPDARNWQFFRQGIYRMDGAAIAPDSVTWEDGGSSKNPTMTWQADAPFPLVLNGVPPTAASEGDGITRLDVSSLVSTPKPRRPFTNRNNEHDGFMLDRPIVLRPAKPGWYALWFTLTPELSLWPPQPLRPDDTLRARIIVHYMVARRERINGTGGYFTRPDLAWLWEGTTEPATRAIDPNLVRAHTVEIPLVLRRDGWAFDHAEIKRANPANDYLDKQLPAPGSGELTGAIVKASALPSSRGMTATYTSSIFERKDRNAPFPTQPSRTATLTWDLEFPAELKDSGAGLVVARGGITRTGGDALFQNRQPADYREDFLPTWIHEPASPTTDARGVGMRIEKIRSPREDYKRVYLSDWGWKVGDPDGSRFWQVTEAGGPPAAGQANRFILFAHPWNPAHVTAQNRAMLPMLYADLGPQALFQIDAGPWRVEAHYRRKKDPGKVSAGAAPTAGPATIANEKDPFWEWFPSYSRLLRETNLEAGRLNKENAIDRTLMVSARNRARILLDAFQAANDPGSYSDWFASGETRATMSDAMQARLAAAAGKANTEAFAAKTAILQRVEKMRSTRGAVLAELRRVVPKFIDRHPELTLWERDQRRQLESIDIEAALGTGDLGLFQAVMARANAQPDSMQPEALLALAQLQQENGDPAGALESLRIVARQQPGNRDAAERLRELECAFIKVALEKSQGAIAQARKHFNTYLKERGYGAKDQAWVGGMRARGLSAIDGETAWAIFSTGVTGAVSGILGRPEEEARALDATERDMTVAYLGAQTILRLRARGHTLAAIKTFTTAQLNEALNHGRDRAPALPLGRARELGVALHVAFQLPELQGLLSESPDALRRGLAAGYWNAKDVGNTWAEWVGDLTSPKNLVMNLLPMSIGRVGGQMQGVVYWTRAEAAVIQGSTGTAYVDTGTMVLARMAQWDRALGAIGATERGQKFIQLLERSQRYQESLGLVGQAGWTLGKMVAMMGVQGAAAHAAEEIGGPRAAQLVEFLMLFGGDTDLMLKFLDGARISRQAARFALDSFRITAEQQAREIRLTQVRMVELQHMLEQRYRGKQLPPLRRTPPPEFSPPLRPTGAATKTAPFTPPVVDPNLPPQGPLIPNSQPGNDSRILLEAGETGLLQDTDNGAIAAAKQLEAELLKEAEEIAEKAKQARQAAEALATAPPTPPLPVRPAGEKGVAPAAFGGYELPPQPAGGSYWEQASRAKFRGDYDEAENLLLQLKKKHARDAAAGKPLGPHDLPPDLIADELALVRELKLSPHAPTPARGAAQRISAAIADGQVAAILALERTLLNKPGASGPVWETKGGDYIIKGMVAGEGNIKAQGDATAEQILEWMVNAEIIGTALRHAAGAPMPGVQVKPVWRTENGVHKLVSAETIYRRVPGPRLDEITPGQQFLLHEQLSEHHGLDVLFGDFDGKSDNFMIHAGVAFKIDAGMADPRGLRARFWNVPANHPRLVHGSSNGEYWYKNAFEQRLTCPVEKLPLVLQTWRLHTAMTAEPAMRGVNRLKALLANATERAKLHANLRESCRRIYGNHPEWGGSPQLEGKLTEFANESLEFLEQRFSEAENAIRELNNRNGMPPLSSTGAAPRLFLLPNLSPVQPLTRYLPGEQMAA